MAKEMSFEQISQDVDGVIHKTVLDLRAQYPSVDISVNVQVRPKSRPVFVSRHNTRPLSTPATPPEGK